MHKENAMRFFKSILLSTLMLSGATFLLSGCASSRGEGGSYRQIGADDAASLMQTEKDYIILDVRTAEEFAAGHIPGAINLPNESIGEAQMPELSDKKQLILVYCRSGRRSKQAAEKLVKLGYTNIVEFGGINDWSGEITTAP
jgi:rhodanese-related sulfurtransferase